MNHAALLVPISSIDTKELIGELEHWVKIESPTVDKRAVNRMAKHVEECARKMGLHVERCETSSQTGDALIVTAAGAEDLQDCHTLLLAHIDTVHPIGTLAEHAPWRIEGQNAFGPGIYDMKAGTLMALEAMRLAGAAAKAALLIVPDEEMGSRASRSLIESCAKGMRQVIVTEPARDGGKIVTSRRGSAIYDIVVHGRAAHSGTRPQDGRSAVRAAARLVLELEALADPEAGIGVNVGKISGGTARNTVPDKCRLLVDVRLPDVETGERVIRMIESLRVPDPDIRLEIIGGVTRPPFPRSPGGDALFARAAALADDVGYELIGMASGGGSDGNFTAALGIPTLCGMGADGEGAHTHHECIYLESLAPRLALLVNLMLDLATKPLDGGPGDEP